ncbi:hypothetical protein J1614_002215 [Plenodomus biglobosus]|nr:hypothetical protein J1614_002215 [Plenodomus biglobosus]
MEIFGESPMIDCKDQNHIRFLYGNHHGIWKSWSGSEQYQCRCRHDQGPGPPECKDGDARDTCRWYDEDCSFIIAFDIITRKIGVSPSRSCFDEDRNGIKLADR